MGRQIVVQKTLKVWESDNAGAVNVSLLGKSDNPKSKSHHLDTLISFTTYDKDGRIEEFCLSTNEFLKVIMGGLKLWKSKTRKN